MPPPADIAGAALYLATGGLCLWTARRARVPHWWTRCALFLAAWAAARLADLEGHGRTLLRAAWTSGNDYSERGIVQAGFVAALLVVAGGATLLVLRAGSARGWSAGGLAALVALAALRTVSWHATDRLLYASLGPIRLHYLLELAALACIAWAALGAAGNRRA